MIDDTFDDANRNTSRSITLASGFVGTTSETRTYDALSRGREEEGSHRLRNNPGLGARYDMSQVIAVYGSSDTWKQNFIWGARIDEILALEQADVLDYDSDANTTELTRSYYHLNALGSVMEITDANQAGVVSYRYTPYGDMTITRGGVAQAADPLGQYWGYTGRFSDEETELWYYRARYYDPVGGRFLSRDPIGYVASPSLYEYVRGRPNANGDPTGLKPGDAAAIRKALRQTEARLDALYSQQNQLKAIMALVAILTGATAVNQANNPGAAVIGGAIGGGLLGELGRLHAKLVKRAGLQLALVELLRELLRRAEGRPRHLLVYHASQRPSGGAAGRGGPRRRRRKATDDGQRSYRQVATANDAGAITDLGPAVPSMPQSIGGRDRGRSTFSDRLTNGTASSTAVVLPVMSLGGARGGLNVPN